MHITKCGGVGRPSSKWELLGSGWTETRLDQRKRCSQAMGALVAVLLSAGMVDSFLFITLLQINPAEGLGAELSICYETISILCMSHNGSCDVSSKIRLAFLVMQCVFSQTNTKASLLGSI